MCELVNVHMRETNNVETLRIRPNGVILWKNCEPVGVPSACMRAMHQRSHLLCQDEKMSAENLDVCGFGPEMWTKSFHTSYTEEDGGVLIIT